MPILPKYQLKALFESGDKITQNSMFNLIDSSHNPTLIAGSNITITKVVTPSGDQLTISSIDGGGGPQGPQGFQGSVGPQGFQGFQGLQGPSGFYAQTADGTAITSGATETSLIGAGEGGLSVPANGFSVGDSFSVIMGGRISTAGGSETIRIRVKADNGVTTIDLADSGVQTLPSATNEAFDLRVSFTIRAIGAATVASIKSMSSFMVQKSSSGNLEGFEFNNIESTNFDTTLINTLDITAEWGGAGNSVQSQYFTLTKIF